MADEPNSANYLFKTRLLSGESGTQLALFTPLAVELMPGNSDGWRGLPSELNHL